MDRRSALKKTGWLLGSGMMVSSSGLLMQSCMEKAKEKNVQTEVLSAIEVDTLKAILQHLIPDNDLPEAIRLAIPMYIDGTLMKYTDQETKNTFEEGMIHFEEACTKEYGATFVDCAPVRQLEYLKKLESEFVKSEGPNFYGMVKQWIFEAFFQTEFGVTNYLVYDPLPGSYQGCVPMGNIGRIQHSNDAFKL